MLIVIIDIINILINVIVMVVIVQFILSLLIMFNVISMRNAAVASIYSSLNMVLDPLLAPIRRILPATGALDFSPIVLLVGLQILQRVLYWAAFSV